MPSSRRLRPGFSGNWSRNTPREMTKADLAEAAGQSPTSSGYSNNLRSWRRAIATPNICVGHGNRSLRRLAVSGLGRVAAARPPRVGGLRNLRTKSMGVVFFGN